MRRFALLPVVCLSLAAPSFAAQPAASLIAPSRSAQYAEVQRVLQQGWNTWNTDTVTSAVHLPSALEIRLGLKLNSTENATAFLPTALIGRQGATDEQVHPGLHAYDGSYTELNLVWHGLEVKLESAHAGPDEVMLVTPETQPAKMSQPASAVFSAGFLWNQPGTVTRKDHSLSATAPGSVVEVFPSDPEIADLHVPLAAPFLELSLRGPAGISTGRHRSVPEIQAILQQQRTALLQTTAKVPTDTASIRRAIQTTLAWDTIYEPEKRRVLSPVSRIWNENWGGYVLFDWDTFFAGTLASIDNRGLAYANVIEVLNEATSQGFVPNYARAGNWKSADRSEPPVGAITVLALYRRYHDKWLLQQTFDALLRWNTWWTEHRDVNGYLAWGSDGDAPAQNLDDSSRGTLFGSVLESGLDNSPMYDKAGFDGHHMLLADVGLLSMFIADGNALATIADEIGRKDDAALLRKRAEKYSASLATLWDPTSAIYRNKDLRTGELSQSLSPTNFYPLLANAPKPAEADEMIRRHLLNPDEFWDDRVLPSIARNDPAFKDQTYWRGRIWGPMNFLVYLGLRNYSTPLAQQARRDLATKSTVIFLEEWRTKGHVHENYSGTGQDSDTVANSDRFYHWGALMGLLGYLEADSSPHH